MKISNNFNINTLQPRNQRNKRTRRYFRNILIVLCLTSIILIYFFIILFKKHKTISETEKYPGIFPSPDIPDHEFIIKEGKIVNERKSKGDLLFLEKIKQANEFKYLHSTFFFQKALLDLDQNIQQLSSENDINIGLDLEKHYNERINNNDMLYNDEIIYLQRKIRNLQDFLNIPLTTPSPVTVKYNTLNGPSIIPFGNLQNNLQRTYNYLFTNLNKYKSQFIIYPYPFNYTYNVKVGTTENGTDILKEYSSFFNQGAILNVKPYAMPSTSYFNYLYQSLSIMNLMEKSKALYDMNIAVLKIDITVNGTLKQLTYEAPFFCSSLVTYLGIYRSTCLSGKDFMNYYATSTTTSFVYVDHKDIDGVGYTGEKSILFTKDSGGKYINRFGVLIIPDIMLGSEEKIAELLGTQGLQNIDQFVRQGGTLYTSGKGGLILEYISSNSSQLWASQLFDKNYLLTSKDQIVKTKGCDQYYMSTSTDLTNNSTKSTSDSDLNLIKRIACFSLIKNNEKDYYENYLLSSHLVNCNSEDDCKLKFGVETLYEFDSLFTSLRLKEVNTGWDTSFNVSTFLPMMLYKPHKQGKIIINLANPNLNANSFPYFFNILFLVMGRNLIFNSRIMFGKESDIPTIPGYEADMILNMEFEFLNLYDRGITDFSINLFLPKNVEPLKFEVSSTSDYDLKSECNFVNRQYSTIDFEYSKDMFTAGTRNDVNSTFIYNCYFPQLEAFTTTKLKFRIEILDPSVTQNKNNVLMLYPLIEYYTFGNNNISETLIREFVDYGPLYVNTQRAAVITSYLNTEPNSFYPLSGVGKTVDNVIPIENKQETTASNVEFVAIVPIVSPLFDATGLAKKVYFWDKYYKKETNGLDDYYFPFKKNNENNRRNWDVLDYEFLKGKGIVLAADWDTPVKITKAYRSDLPIQLSESQISINSTMNSIKYVNYSSTNTNPFLVTKQEYFEGDSFFEQATPRQLVFIDTTIEEGAAIFYGNDSIPAYYKHPDKNSTKHELLWVRTDVFFYKDTKNTQVEGLDIKAIISIDRYKSNFTETGCNINGNITKQGYFNDSMSNGLLENEYSNILLDNCGNVKFPYDQIDTEFPRSDDNEQSVKRVRYLIPITNNEIYKPSHVLHFDEITGEYSKGYPEIRFVYAYTSSFLLEQEFTTKGGYLLFKLPNGSYFDIPSYNPNDDNLITYSADHISFYKTEYDRDLNYVKSYFKRGSAPETSNNKPSEISVNFEKLIVDDEYLQFLTPSSKNNALKRFTMDLNVFRLKYDLSSPDTMYESYIEVPQYNRVINCEFKPFFSLPAVKLVFSLKRTPKTINPYEVIEPFARFGVMYQELERHSTIYGSAEVHPIKDTGFVADSPGFSVISHIGTSSIPFREYLTGMSQFIPSSSETSRVQWTDIWGRIWMNDVRSSFPDVPPIPPPSRNFMMQTTFEVTKRGTTERILKWNSDDELDVFIKLKLTNNFPKYFSITTCKENELSFNFDTNNIANTSIDTGSSLLYQKNNINYGKCFSSSEESILNQTRLSSKSITFESRELLENSYLCSESFIRELTELGTEYLKNCTNQTFTISKRNGNDKATWNYSPLVQNYYPTNYVKDNMWDLTHYDYDDNYFSKAYPYHMDNYLPNLLNEIKKPQNLIAFPLLKGLGYGVSYSKTYSITKYSNKKGWWSDNLQNKDHTLLAGQTVSYDVADDKTSPLKSTDWISIDKLPIATMGGNTERLVNETLKNIYSCLFNRYNIRLDSRNPKIYYSQNVYQNNIIPIIPSLSYQDSRLTNYSCDLSISQHTPESISGVDNTVYTNAGKTWLYFASSLRGNAHETLNIVYRIYQQYRYEGLLKIQDGATFIYLNPATGLNGFFGVGNPVNTINAERSDLSISCELFPQTTTTFFSQTYDLITIQDNAEQSREYTNQIYTNQYGFGDSVVSITVGGEKGTSSILSPGAFVITKISFFNNAGFDWPLLVGAIVWNETLYTERTDELLSTLKHTIQLPIKYNFITPIIPAELTDYITIEPSNHLSDIDPMLFDYQNNNVATIRNGFRGDYFYNIRLSTNVPKEIRGKVWSIPVQLNETYFKQLPGYNDPTIKGYHDYKLIIPDIKIGIPFESNRLDGLSGKVFYTIGFSTTFEIKHSIPDYWEVSGAKIISDGDVTTLRSLSTTDGVYSQLNTFFYDTLNNNPQVNYTIQLTTRQDGTISKDISLDVNTYFPTLPLKLKGMLDQTKFNILLRKTTKKLPFGNNYSVYGSTLNFIDNNGNKKKTSNSYSKLISTKGAWLSVSYEGVLVDPITLEPLADQKYYLISSNNTLQNESKLLLIVKVINVGSDIAYRVNYTIPLGSGVNVSRTDLDKNNVNYNVVYKEGTGNEVLYLNSQSKLNPGVAHLELVYLKIVGVTKEELLQLTNKRTTMNFLASSSTVQRQFVEKVVTSIALTNANEISVEQSFETPYVVTYLLREKDRVSLQGYVVTINTTAPISINDRTVANGDHIIRLSAIAFPETTIADFPIRFNFYKKVLFFYDNSSTTFITKDWKLFTSTYKSNIEVFVEYDNEELLPINRSFILQYKVQTVDENHQLLAFSDICSYQFTYTPKPKPIPANSTNITPINSVIPTPSLTVVLPSATPINSNVITPSPHSTSSTPAPVDSKKPMNSTHNNIINFNSTITTKMNDSNLSYLFILLGVFLVCAPLSLISLVVFVCWIKRRRKSAKVAVICNEKELADIFKFDEPGSNFLNGIEDQETNYIPTIREKENITLFIGGNNLSRPVEAGVRTPEKSRIKFSRNIFRQDRKARNEVVLDKFQTRMDRFEASNFDNV
ncbi:hypothetical protein ABK040_009570 [Willaertia magna]